MMILKKETEIHDVSENETQWYFKGFRQSTDKNNNEKMVK